MSRKRYENFVSDASGNVVAGASALFYPASNHAVPSTIYSTSGGAGALTNPAVSNSNGMFFAYLEDGRYDIQVSKPGLTTFWLTDIVSIAYDETERTDNKGIANGYAALDANAALPTAYLNTTLFVPTGAVSMFAGSAAPSGWLLCDGGFYDSTLPIYVPLFNVIGYTYGQSSTSFRVPYFNGRSPVGAGAGSTRRPGGNTLYSTTMYYGMTTNDTYIWTSSLGGASIGNIPQRGVCVYEAGNASYVWEYDSVVLDVGLGLYKFHLAPNSPANASLPVGTAFYFTGEQASLSTGTTRTRGEYIGQENAYLNEGHIPPHKHSFPWQYGGLSNAGAQIDTNYIFHGWHQTQRSPEHAGQTSVKISKSLDIVNPGVVVNFIIKI